MSKARLPILSILLLAGLAACGHKGALLPPLVKIPSPPSDLKLLQRGDKLTLEWKNPATFIDGRPLEAVSAVDIWLVEETL
jgi:predicted small lipoprotein YifL